MEAWRTHVQLQRIGNSADLLSIFPLTVPSITRASPLTAVKNRTCFPIMIVPLNKKGKKRQRCMSGNSNKRVESERRKMRMSLTMELKGENRIFGRAGDD